MNLEFAFQILSFGVSVGIAVGLLKGKFATKNDLAEHERNCHCSLEKKFEDVNQARRDIWEKIDQIHGWLMESKK